MSDPGQSELCVVLLSGGLDSTTTLALARRREGRPCIALSFDYGQRHSAELSCAARIAAHFEAEHRVVSLDPAPFAASALTWAGSVPHHREPETIGSGIPPTYVPARNLVLLAMATAVAESAGAAQILIGANVVDYSGYPDCRPQFIEAYERTANLATRAGAEQRPIRVRAPLIDMTKGQIITLGGQLGVDYAMTSSCYDQDEAGRACGSCDACILRRRGFAEAGVPDPTTYLP